ncbi:MAG: sucrase ferredoxin, partial [Nocardioidaceae bacterium]
MRCSTWRRLVDEPAIGSAAHARAWVALEQPGPWGAKAPTQSRLDPRLGKTLEKRLKSLDSRLALIRHPAGSTDRHATDRQVFAACSAPGATVLLSGTVTDPAELLDLDLEALLRGDAEAVTRSLPALSEHAGPVLLVCVNGKRDVCCALLGRPTAYALHDEFGDAVWEANHLGGHRFAPTTALLPSGYSHAGVDPE